MAGWKWVVLTIQFAAVVAQIAPATNKAQFQRFRSDFAGAGTKSVGAVTIEYNTGNITLSGRSFSVFGYEWQVSGEYHIIRAVGIRDDGADVASLCLYCSSSGMLEHIYHGSYSSAWTSESASGTCSFAKTTNQNYIKLPAITALPAKFNNFGFHINGNQPALPIALNENSGKIWVPGLSNLTLTPFTMVDCTKCAGGPWYELHSILDQRPGLAMFGILYLYPPRVATQSNIELSFTLDFPNLDTPTSAYNASWSRQ
jgi:hypothetical protein